MIDKNCKICNKKLDHGYGRTYHCQKCNTYYIFNDDHAILNKEVFTIKALSRSFRIVNDYIDKTSHLYDFHKGYNLVGENETIVLSLSYKLCSSNYSNIPEYLKKILIFK